VVAPAAKEESRMTFDSCLVSDAYVLTPRKNLTGGDETTALTAAVAELPIPRVVIDFGKISWVNSLGLEELKRARRVCLDRQGWFRLACIGKRIESILLTTRLVLVFDTFETVEEAVAAQEKGSTMPSVG